MKQDPVGREVNPRSVIDLFSCGGGMSAGFAGRPGWTLTAAVDLEVAKPSGKAAGETGCNAIYPDVVGMHRASQLMKYLVGASLPAERERIKKHCNRSSRGEALQAAEVPIRLGHIRI